MKKRNKTKYIVIHCSATDVNFNGGASEVLKISIKKLEHNIRIINPNTFK